MAQDKSTPTISFSVYYAGKLVREASFDRPIINIGKLSTSNMRLNDINVSRKHAVIERRDSGEWRITDLGSTNGTTVNGRRITQAPLRDADRILVGNTTLVVHYDRPAGAAGDGDRPRKKTEEIQGLGENSFYADDQAADEGTGEFVLEVALLWGETVLSIEHYDKPSPVLVGEQRGCRFTIPEEALGVTRFTLIGDLGGKFALNLDNPRFQGDVLVDGSVMPIGELGKMGKLDGGKLIIDEPMRARLRVGEFILLVSYGHMPARPRVSPLAAIDYTPHIYVALSAIVHLAFLVFLRLMPPEQLMSRADRDERRLKMIELMKVAQLEEEEEEKEDEEEEEKKKGEDEDKKRLDVAKSEIEQPKKTDDSLLNKLAKKQKKKLEEELTQLTPEERQKRAKDLAQNAGAAKVLSEETSLLRSLLDEKDQGLFVDNKRITALTSMAAEDETSLAGAGAIDPFGGTLGTGGDDSFGGSRSLGAADPNGGPGGPGGIMSDLGKKSGKRSLDDIRVKERTVTPVAIASSAKVSGRLDRKTVQAIIRRNLSGIRWCYQDALQRNPKLKGKVTLAFTILPSGKVQNPSAKNPSIADQQLLKCITKKMGRWRFPSPKDGGVVKVSYPLILKTR